MSITQEEIIKEFYINNPNRDIRHAEAVDWATKEYRYKTGKVLRDPDRAVRKLYQKGILIKVSKGVYRYDPEFAGKNRLDEFSPEVKKMALERDGYKCVICGLGIKDGVELHVDHIIPQDRGGDSTLSNAQILCSEHNFLKKNLKQTETGKKMFIRLYEKAKEEDNFRLMAFCMDILDTFEEHNINGHIEWTK